MTAVGPTLDPATLHVRLQLGRELEALRTLAGITQRELKDKTGLSQAHISRIENGQTAPFNHEIAAWVNVTGGDDKLDRLIALNEAIHNGVAAATAAGASRTFTLVDDDKGNSHVRVQTLQAELLITEPAAIERFRALFDQVTGSALSHHGTRLTVRQTDTKPEQPS
jgi:transcriptional regulator with XRE-family HTH domain